MINEYAVVTKPDSDFYNETIRLLCKNPLAGALQDWWKIKSKCGETALHPEAYFTLVKDMEVAEIYGQPRLVTKQERKILDNIYARDTKANSTME